MNRLWRAAVIGLASIAGAHAAPPNRGDPNWPCQQIKVPELSLAAVWSGPRIDPAPTAWKGDQHALELAQQLAPRRQPLERAGEIIHSFAQQSGDQKVPQLLKLLAGVYNILDGERSSVIAGLDRIGIRQQQLADGIRADNEKLRALQSTDPSAAQDMLQRVKWEAEVFQDRRQAISYACDAPSKIEQRLFALAHLIQRELE